MAADPNSCAVCDREPTGDDLDRRLRCSWMVGAYDVEPFTLGGWIRLPWAWLCSWGCVEKWAHERAKGAAAAP